jgi:hypothetical protein
MATRPPLLEEVLSNIRLGRVAYLCVTPEQKRTLRDREGQIALDVLRHLLGARPMVPERFPLTEGAFQAVARRLGYAVGGKRCRRMIKRLRVAGVVGRAGQYRQPYRNSAVRSGFCVTLHKLGARLRVARLSRRKHPVGSRVGVKGNPRLRWWQHALFGDYWGRPPPELPRLRLRRMTSLDEVFQGER